VEAFPALVAALHAGRARFVLIGVWAANLHARSAAAVFTTQDYDLFLPADVDNTLLVWRACESVGLELLSGDEPRDEPRDRLLAERVVQTRALVRATERQGLDVDLTLVMEGFTFEEVWAERRVFLLEGVEVPVARLSHVVRSKAAAGRPKDLLFRATHEEALRDLMTRED
jgi:hypothetical protein